MSIICPNRGRSGKEFGSSGMNSKNKASEDKKFRSSERWFHILIETKARELDSKLLLACCAAERGYSVLLGWKNSFNKCMEKIPIGVVYEKSIAINKLQLLKKYRDVGHRIIVNDEEASAIYVRPEFYCETRLSLETLSLADRYLTWGVRQKEIMDQCYPTFADRIRNTGTPRTDLWMEPLCGLYDKAAEEYRQKYGRYIFMPSNFGGPINSRGRDFEEKQAERYGLVRNQVDREWFRGRIEHTAQVLPAYIEALRAVRVALPDHSLIVRPHPAESSAYWKRVVADIDNCHVVHEKTATPWILGSEAMFHHGCTTAIEALLMGKPSIAYVPQWDGRYIRPFDVGHGPIAERLDDLIAFLRQAVDSEHFTGKTPIAISEHICTAPGTLAADRIAAELDTISWPKNSVGRTLRNLTECRSVRSIAAKSTKAFLRSIQNAVTRGGDDGATKWPGTDTNELEEKLAFFRSALKRFETVVLTRVSDNIFLVRMEAKSNH